MIVRLLRLLYKREGDRRQDRMENSGIFKTIKKQNGALRSLEDTTNRMGENRNAS